MRVISKIFKVLMDLLLAVMVIAAMSIVVPNLFGVKTLAVLSGSMEPAYPVGSMVYAAPTPPEQINTGDPISFVINEEGSTVTHRVIEADRENRQFITQGDANNVEDAQPVLYENVIGVVRFHIPLAGFVLGLTLTTRGKIIVVTVIISLILLTLLMGVDDPKKKEPGKQSEPQVPSREDPQNKAQDTQ